MTLIGFEGLGGSGKSTLIRAVQKISLASAIREQRYDADAWAK